MDAVALFNYDPLTDNEIQLDEGDKLIVLNTNDPDWWLVKRLQTEQDKIDGIEAEEGFVPKGYVKLLNSDSSNPEETKVDEIQENISETDNFKLKKRTYTKDTIVMPSFKELPSGFRDSTTQQYLNSGKGRLSSQIMPSIDSCGFFLTDFKQDLSSEKLADTVSACNVAFTVLEARSIPYPSDSFDIKGRYLNLCLFDKLSIIGNVMSIPAMHDPKRPQTWLFSNSSSALFNRNDSNVGFIRSSVAAPDLYVLFELVVLISTNSSQSNYKEMTSGWGMIPLFQADGKELESKQYEVKLYGGTPYDENIPLTSLPLEKDSIFSWGSRKFPRVIVKFWNLGRQVLQQLNKLPGTIIAPLNSINIMYQIRRDLYDKMLYQKETPDLNPRFYPSVSILADLLDDSDILIELSKYWEESSKSLSRSQRKDMNSVRQKLLESIYLFWPMKSSVSVPTYRAGDERKRQERFVAMTKFMSNGPIVNFGQNPDQIIYKPFDTIECTVSLQNQIKT